MVLPSTANFLLPQSITIIGRTDAGRDDYAKIGKIINTNGYLSLFLPVLLETL